MVDRQVLGSAHHRGTRTNGHERHRADTGGRLRSPCVTRDQNLAPPTTQAISLSSGIVRADEAHPQARCTLAGRLSTPPAEWKEASRQGQPLPKFTLKPVTQSPALTIPPATRRSSTQDARRRPDHRGEHDDDTPHSRSTVHRLAPPPRPTAPPAHRIAHRAATAPVDDALPLPSPHPSCHPLP
jgi:hypothetical protein